MARQEFVINVTELMGNVVFMVRVPRHGSFAIKVSRGGQKSEKKNLYRNFLEIQNYS